MADEGQRLRDKEDTLARKQEEIACWAKRQAIAEDQVRSLKKA
jgi:hypothetical protein